MRWSAAEDVEALLLRERRARLPLARQLLIYLDPFSLFKNACAGSRTAQEIALSYNRAMRWVLIPYIRRWVVIAGALFLGIAPAEAMASQAAFFILPAAVFAVGACVAVAVAACTVAAYVLLGSR
jgi:hypothetical protein